MRAHFGFGIWDCGCGIGSTACVSGWLGVKDLQSWSFYAAAPPANAGGTDL